MGAMQAYDKREELARLIDRTQNRPMNAVDFVVFAMGESIQYYLSEALTVLPPAYALLYYLGHVGHAKQTMPLAK